MRIRFETTIEDVIAFNRFHFTNSPAWRRQIWTQTLIVPVLLLLLFVLVHLVAVDIFANPFLALQVLPIDLICAAVMIPASIGSYFFIRWYMNRALEGSTRKFLAEGSNRVLFGWCEMDLVNGRLILKTELIDSSLDLRAIEKIVSDDNYTYVYIASVSAYMIPMNLYPEDEYREFVAELRESWENRDAPGPTDEKACNADARIAEKPL